MRFSQLSHRLVAGGLVVASTLLVQHAAVAASTSFTRTFNTPRGTFTQSGTASFAPATGIVSRSESTTGPLGRTQSFSFTSTPDGRGGFEVTHSFTGFNGKTQSSSRQVGR